MSVALRRLASLVPVLAFAVLGTAHAQVTIHLTTTQQTSCDVTTDANGLRLVPGGTDLMATGVTLSGTGCGGGSGSPPTPNNFALTAPATAVTGTAFAVSWNVSGATSCTGSADLNGSSVILSGWTDVTSTTSPRNATATAAGTYTLSLTCSNTAGSATSLPATVVVTQGGGGGGSCPTTPRTLATISDIHYLPEPPAHVRHTVDLTLWDNIWGHINETDDVTPWPGVSGSSPTIWTIGKTQYVAAKFHTSSLTTTNGFFKNVSYGAGPNLDMAISQSCGDFAPTEASCLKTNIPSSDTPLVFWRLDTVVSNSYCHLTPNSDYYVNIQFHDPNTSGPGCSGGTCKTTIQLYHN
jgi:hypothetical protein